MTSGASDEEAAWRDLVAHYGTPAVSDGMGDPWPARENLLGSAAAPGPADRESARPDEAGTDEAGTDEAMGGQADPAGDAPGMAGPQPAASDDPVPGVIPAPPQIRIVRPAVPLPPPATGDDDPDDGHYVPPDPPPLPRLDPVSKFAWAALFGGPGYLLVAVTLGWVIPGWAAFCAVAAFVGGFATLVVRLGDRAPRDSGPDDGAVV